MAEKKVPFEGFVGPSYTDRAHGFDNQETINLYLEQDPTGQGKNKQPVIFMGTPGLKNLQTIGSGPIRGTYTVSNQIVNEQISYVVSGNEVYQLSGSNSIPILQVGTLTTSTGPVSISDNGIQILIVDGQNGYYITIGATAFVSSFPYYSGAGNGTISDIGINQSIATAQNWDLVAINSTTFSVTGSVSGSQSDCTVGTAYSTPDGISWTITAGSTAFTSGDEFTFSISGANTLVQITDPNFYPADNVTFQDGYFILNRKGTNQFFLSDLYSIVFPALNVESKSGNSDPIVSVISVSRQLYLLGTDTTEIWWDSGASGSSPFARQDGRFSQVGCAAAHTPVILAEQFFWLGSNAQGTGVVYTIEGSLPKRISTSAVEFSIQNAQGNIAESTAFSYQSEGHYFYCLNVPGTNCTWVYDMVTEQWHKRQDFPNGVAGRWYAETHCLLNNVHIIGDYRNGNIYKLDLDTYTDNGEPKHYIRQTPIVAENLNNMFHKLLQIDGQMGVGLVNQSTGGTNIDFNDLYEGTDNTEIVNHAPNIGGTYTMVTGDAATVIIEGGYMTTRAGV